MIDVGVHGGCDLSIVLIPSKTVPRGVSLTPAIDPRALKHANITLNIDWSGQMTLSGFFRVRSFLPVHDSILTAASISALPDHLQPPKA